MILRRQQKPSQRSRRYTRVKKQLQIFNVHHHRCWKIHQLGIYNHNIPISYNNNYNYNEYAGRSIDMAVTTIITTPPITQATQRIQSPSKT
uniref:Uncharacterized protein n=1 Tax=Tanacetum cinerariifolium TaxID=118510 RepID=A0A699HI24_TANCI|nr:hypothetical protein [Tanacetum cinerariifolium]